VSDENDPYYTDAEQRREAINTILDCTRYWPSPREHIVFKGMLAEIDRLRVQALGTQRRIQDQDAIMAELWERIHAITAERDEARREVCALRVLCTTTSLNCRQIAVVRGWDCFEKEEQP
jgi:hypothetical protein